MRRLLIPAMAFGLLVGCAGTAERRAADRAAVEKLLAAYPAALAEAYANGTSSPLASIVTGRELDRVDHRIAELRDQGQALRARLLDRTVTSIDLHSATAGTATVREVWTLRVVALGSEETLGESASQENELVYSLIRDHGRWLVLSRMLKHSSEPAP